MERPLLLIYLVRGMLKDDLPFADGLVLPALALHFPGEADQEARKRYVRYRLNRVAQAEMDFGIGEDVPADEDIDD
jgi:hypothetical protein